MRNYHNIEKHPIRRGQYVGYADGAWTIIRWGNHWRAFCRTHNDDVNLYANTLGEMSQLLDIEATKTHARYTAIF